MSKELLIESNHVLTYNKTAYSVNKLMNIIYNDSIKLKIIELKDIKHMLTNKIWVYENKPLSPNMVTSHKEKYMKIYNDIIRSDIFYPVIMLDIGDNLLLIDGHHRVTKSIMFDIPTIEAYIVDMNILNRSII
jgi:ParB-like chromosome segregation protein Spo0J